MVALLSFLIVAISGFSFFVLGEGLWTLVGLFVVSIFTRFNSHYKDFGKLVEMLFVFCLIAFVTNQLSFADSIRAQGRLDASPGISYPYSLIIILTFMVVLIFYEGPEWGKLFFGAGKTKDYFKPSLLLILIAGVAAGSLLFFNRASLVNPVPTQWPTDVLVLLGLGFAFYLALVEETIFRSFLLQRAQAVVGVDFAIPIQGVFFGLMYYKSGVPGGPIGVVFGSLFGIALGYLVKKSNSVYLSMFVQFVVTFIIFLELVILGKSALH
ncbi:MAG: CPBP family intramembrane glutamic endopeptidase [bacterium]